MYSPKLYRMVIHYLVGALFNILSAEVRLAQQQIFEIVGSSFLHAHETHFAVMISVKFISPPYNSFVFYDANIELIYDLYMRF